MAFKIYTKTGDKGLTSLIGGTRVSKHHIRIESYGTIDELNSYIGLLKDQILDTVVLQALLEIQDRLFTIGASLASDPEKSKMKLPDIIEKDILFLESEIDRMQNQLPELKSFILPGGHTTVSYGHIARCVCRRAERITSMLAETSFVAPFVIPYLNRLSDYLFVLSRFLSYQLNVAETVWKPRI